ncbi:MAG: hypothetical protein ACI81P_002565 [Neolewinella sp.]
MSTTYIFQALRKAVVIRAKGICEYCLIPEVYSLSIPYHIDHIISEKHRGLRTIDNLALACPICNINKGSDVATFLHDIKVTVPLYNPRVDKWGAHFRLDQSGELIPLSEVGQGTIFLLKLNDDETNVLRKVLVNGGIKLTP